MATKFKNYHNRAMKLHGNLFSTICTLSYGTAPNIQAYDIKCSINGLTDADIATGKYTSSTLYFTLYYDDIKVAKDKKTGVSTCILNGFKGKSITFEGTKYAIDAENPNGSTRDCVVLRGVLNV
jgi:hypothetical protein